ncbi:GvpL/GvpF family gas vesicle protein [Micromonospora sp. DR5-3]|uniref:GvpL/GvpF family gas vesicle protein n=1 Tax=unclassified Micromonospora TaxID=2617518 RepID=UPI0011D2FE48|nr:MULTISPECIES: GvpL/GvpF family gas vesicle protein [unclassified Micromonospora]MCW3819414.1 GvpL/GvpF family gas vesicle protein [Micromonospora sp. DR5-3]TYC20798.1 GvpL/GvpF family gas vesicle protein [Micromonospora sp. MP36]
MTANRAIYLYAIVPPTAAAPTMSGVYGEPTQLLHASGLGVVISEVSVENFAAINDDSGDPARLGQLARRHDAVVRAAADAADAALPLRLGTVVTERQALSDLLAVRGEQLRRLLDKVAGCDEFGVRVAGRTGANHHDAADTHSATPDAGGTPADAAHGDHAGSPSASAGDGLAYLQQRREALQRVQRRRQATATLAADVDAALREQAVDAVTGRGGNLLDRTYLVHRDRSSVFIEVVDQCGDRVAAEGYQLSLNGPWPPYSFSVTNLEVAGRG